MKHLVQLHLSRDCNRPALAADAGAMLADVGSSAAVITAVQYATSRVIQLDGKQQHVPA